MTTTQLPRIDVDLRQIGTRHAVRLRRAGRLPMVIYGHKQDPLHVSVDYKQFIDLLHRNTHLLEVVTASKTEPCLIKDVQWNHLGSIVVHADLTRVDLTERVTVNVSLELTGEAMGLKETGTLLEHPLNEIEVQCQAANIPDAIRLDVSKLGVGESITVAALPLPEGVEAVTDPETVVAVIRLLAEEPEEEQAAEAAEGEPEVIGKKAEEAAGGEDAQEGD